jgi:Flagellar motor component
VTQEVSDPFFLKGLQMAVDGHEPEKLKEVLDGKSNIWKTVTIRERTSW